MPPKITPEGEKAKASIAAARAAKNASEVRTLKPPKQTTNPQGVITSETLKDTPPFNLTQPKPTVETSGLEGALQATSDEFTKGLEQDMAAKSQANQSSQEAFLDSLLNRTSFEQLSLDAEKEAGLAQAEGELQDINLQILQEQKARRRAREAIEATGGGLKAGAQSEIANLERASIAKEADLSIIQLAKQGKYDSAKAIADRKAKAMFEQEQNTIDALKFNYEDNKDLFTTAEQRLFESTLADRQAEKDAKQAEQKSIQDLAIQALQGGAPASLVAQMQTSKTIAEATELGGSYVGRLDRLQQEASIAASYASRRNSLISAAKSGDPQAVAQLGFDPNKTTPLSEYSNVIDAASLLVGAERGQETRRAMAAAVERGDYQTTYSMLANNVQSALQGESASRFGAARTDIQVLGGLRETIKEFEEAGGDTGFLVGTADQIARKFGQLATDPKFAALAVQLEREFQAYRQSMTGAAFSPAESAEYEKVNPSSTKSLELNSATIDGALRQLENRVVGTTEAYVPGSREIYDLATGKEKSIPTTTPENEPIGSIIEYGGVRYRKVGEDAYEPI